MSMSAALSFAGGDFPRVPGDGECVRPLYSCAGKILSSGQLQHAVKQALIV